MLTTAEIRRKLAAASFNTKDNVAQDIINGATTLDLRGVDAEGVLLLYQALAMFPPRIFSSNDKAALTKLRTNTQFQPVSNNLKLAIDLIKVARPSPHFSYLTEKLIERIYAAEKSRLSWLERRGIDGDTIGRGQLGQPAYEDVIGPNGFNSTFKEYINHVFIPELLKSEYTTHQHHWNFNTYEPAIKPKYKNVYDNPKLEDFVVTAYLAILIHRSTKAGRSTKDTLKFAVAIYHGMRPMVVAAQSATGDTINWSPIETHLRNQGNTDEANYVNEVVK